MVHTSMDVGIYDVGIYGWVNIGFRTTSYLPAAVPTTISAEIHMPSRLPN
jgi:hypothetical protein